jgi:GNAT superfamily N-acetyltransferase
LVTDADYEDYINRRGKGWICQMGDMITGFAIVSLTDNNVWALFVKPGYDKQGIGRQLHDLMIDWYFEQTNTAIWLSTAPGTRAEGFYHKAGWTPTGISPTGEIIFEMTEKKWKRSLDF